MTGVCGRRAPTHVRCDLSMALKHWSVTAKDAPENGGAVVVTVNIYMRSISKIDDVNMEYSAQFTFREEWNDPRLAYGDLDEFKDGKLPDFVVLATSEPGSVKSQQIWMPDTFFQNEKEARRHLIDKPNVLIRIYQSGNILYSVRLTLTLRYGAASGTRM